MLFIEIIQISTNVTECDITLSEVLFLKQLCDHSTAAVVFVGCIIVRLP